jgi:hypothetical protein
MFTVVVDCRSVLFSLNAVFIGMFLKKLVSFLVSGVLHVEVTHFWHWLLFRIAHCVGIFWRKFLFRMSIVLVKQHVFLEDGLTVGQNMSEPHINKFVHVVGLCSHVCSTWNARLYNIKILIFTVWYCLQSFFVGTGLKEFYCVYGQVFNISSLDSIQIFHG